MEPEAATDERATDAWRRDPADACTVVTRSTPGAESLPPVLTVVEVAALLRVDRKAIYKLIVAGELPGVRRIGRVIRVHRDVLLAWLAAPTEVVGSLGQERGSPTRRSR